MEFITNNLGLIGGGAGAVVLFVLKKIPNKKICNVIETFFFGLGRTCTLGLSKWSWSKGVYEKTIEPYITDLLDNIFGSIVRGLIKGLRSDNK